MGKKNRKNRRQEKDEDYRDDDNGDIDEAKGSDHGGAESTTPKSQPAAALNPNDKSLDFKTREALRRQAAQDKRRSKQNCYLCGQAGHVRRECPGIADDGRGMSRFKNQFSDVKTAVQKRNQAKKTAAGTAATSSQEYDTQFSYQHLTDLELPPGFEPVEASSSSCSSSSFDYYVDACCDVAATLEYCKTGRGGKQKISLRQALEEFHHVLHHATTQSKLGAAISQSWIKPNRPWMDPLPSTASPTPQPQRQQQLQRHNAFHRIYYTVGLHRDFLVNDNLIPEAVHALSEALSSSDHRIVGFCCELNFTEEFIARAGCNVDSQRRRCQAACEAAARNQVPIQIRTLPGANSLPPPPPQDAATTAAAATAATTMSANEQLKARVKGTAYAQALLQAQTILLETLDKYPTLQIHWTSWTGLSAHMLTLLQTFPNNLYFGLDGTVTFSKATELHECAFDLPLDKLLLETGRVIPSQVAKVLGRDAFYHSGSLSFTADAVAKLKPTSSDVTAAQVASAAAQTTVALYPQLNQGMTAESTATEESGLES